MLTTIEDMTDQERWLLRLVQGGMVDTSDLARHTGLSAAEVTGTLAGAACKLGAGPLAEAPAAGRPAPGR